MTKEKLIQVYECQAEFEGRFAEESKARLMDTLSDIASYAGLESPDDAVGHILNCVGQLANEYAFYVRKRESHDDAEDALRRLSDMS